MRRVATQRQRETIRKSFMRRCTMSPCDLNCSFAHSCKPLDSNVALNHFHTKSSTKHVNRKFFAFELPSATTSYINFEYYEFRMRRRTACRVWLPSNQHRMLASEKGNKCVPNSHTAFIYHMLNSHNKVYLCAPQPAIRTIAGHDKKSATSHGTKVVNCVLLSM